MDFCNAKNPLLLNISSFILENMRKQDPELPKLTRNDQKVLKYLIQHAKLPDTEIAKKIGISPQAVFKIRHKLEKKEIIKGYTPIIDLKKIGINVMVLLVIKLTHEVWKDTSEQEIKKRIQKIPYVINAYRVPQSNVSHILLMGFRDMKQMDRYLTKIQTDFSREIEIQDVYPFSIDKVITQSPIGLLYEILDKKDFKMDVFFLKKKK
ncbi:winged helix-turn-helix transcriptional regulator [Candidatus Woesearchaeota archaeon]|nr:winged helix-turn-helix transcriptional regulator [Candidatus Woesearchaeota archaeon]